MQNENLNTDMFSRLKSLAKKLLALELMVAVGVGYVMGPKGLAEFYCDVVPDETCKQIDWDQMESDWL